MIMIKPLFQLRPNFHRWGRKQKWQMMGSLVCNMIAVIKTWIIPSHLTCPIRRRSVLSFRQMIG